MGGQCRAPAALPPPRKDPVPIVWEVGLGPGPVWTGAENFTPTWIRSPDRTACNESLYRLSYPSPRWTFSVSKYIDIQKEKNRKYRVQIYIFKPLSILERPPYRLSRNPKLINNIACASRRPNFVNINQDAWTLRFLVYLLHHHQ